MTNHINWLLVAKQLNLFLGKFSVSGKLVPLVDGRKQLAKEPIGINGGVNESLEANAFL